MKWQYKVVSIDSLVQDKSLNDLGKDGWELVGEIGKQLYFKRGVK